MTDSDDEQPGIFRIQYDSPNTSEVDIEEFEKACLNEHNNVRKSHGAPPLALNRKLCDFATQWAKTLIAKGVMEHRPNNQYGENIYAARGKKVDGALPVKSWYMEHKRYNFQEAKFSSHTGHFTQVVWKDTKELGVGIGKKGNETYVVCNYNPAGNIKGRFAENVLPFQKVDTTPSAPTSSQPASQQDAEPAPLSSPQSWALVPYNKKEALLRAKTKEQREANQKSREKPIALGWAADEPKKILSSSSSSSSSASDLEDAQVAGCCNIS